MHKITFECEVITPMFLAGADGVTPELRAPSIKGALRFWWRAMHGDLPLEMLKQKEDGIFGGPDNKSKIIVKINSSELIESEKTFKQKFRRDQDLIYLAYGAEDRYYFQPKSEFKITFLIKERDENKKNEIALELKKAFSLLTHLGGIGAKSRNGFGAFSSTNIDSFEEITQYKIFNSRTSSSFTSISDLTQIYKSSKDFGNWKTALRELKSIYSESKKSIQPKTHRVYIGAPWKKIPFPDRHAKLHPMSIIKNQDDFKYIITYLPYNYLNGYPDKTKKEIQNHKDKWNKAIMKMNDEISNALDKDDEYLVDFTFKEEN